MMGVSIRHTSLEELKILQLLADTASGVLEKVQLYEELIMCDQLDAKRDELARHA